MATTTTTVAVDAPEVNAPSLTDVGNGQRFAAAFGDDARYVYLWKRWVVWNLSRWVEDKSGEIYRMAKQVALAMLNQTAPVGIEVKAWQAWAYKTQSDPCMEAMLKMARSEWPIPAQPEDFDLDPWLLNCKNGTINLLTGEFHEPRREDMLMKRAAVQYLEPTPSHTIIIHFATEGLRTFADVAKNPDLDDAIELRFFISEKIDKVLLGNGRCDGGGVGAEGIDIFITDCTDAEAAVAAVREFIHPLTCSIEQFESFEPSALCPTWTEFMATVMDDDVEMIQFLQRAVGYSLTGLTKERVLFILHGSGKNGKSTFLETIQTLMGDYATVTPVETLMVQKGSQIPNDVAALKNSRFVTASETEEDARMATAKIKRLTGDDTLVARKMHSEWFNFLPTFKVWLGTNHKPKIREAAPAIWDRIRLIPFTVRIAVEDKELKEKLKAEMPGILNWAMEGLRQYQEIGLAPPAKVLAAGRKYQEEQDQVGRFVEERCVMNVAAFTSVKELYDAYKSWCQETGEFVISKNMLSGRLSDRGIATKQTKKARGFEGIAVQATLLPGTGGNVPTEAKVRAESDRAAEGPLFT